MSVPDFNNIRARLANELAVSAEELVSVCPGCKAERSTFPEHIRRHWCIGFHKQRFCYKKATTNLKRALAARPPTKTGTKAPEETMTQQLRRVLPKPRDASDARRRSTLIDISNEPDSVSEGATEPCVLKPIKKDPLRPKPEAFAGASEHKKQNHGTKRRRPDTVRRLDFSASEEEEGSDADYERESEREQPRKQARREEQQKSPWVFAYKAGSMSVADWYDLSKYVNKIADKNIALLIGAK